ncbi:MAG: M1 family metallopeptidase [Bacteroidota bacterium]
MYKRVFTLFLGIILSSSTVIFAQQKNKVYQYDPNSSSREHFLDFERMVLNIEFEPEKGLVKGAVKHVFKAIRAKVDSFFVDGPGITVKEAKLNGQAITYKTNAFGITFFPSKPLNWNTKDSLVIVYEAYPKKGIYFIGWNDSNHISRKQIWTQGQSVDNRYWFPCYDNLNDKLISEVYVKFNKEYKVLSNGLKIEEKDNKDGTKTWHYKMLHPHASYLVMLGIGKYEIKESKSKSGVPLHKWYYPEWTNRIEYTYKYNEKIFDFLESEIGVPYAWGSYSQIPVQDFMFGAMENTTATLFGDFFHVDNKSYNDRNYIGVNAHELAHQWFGDLITARSGNSHWLQESFATYYGTLAEGECLGKDNFDWLRRQAQIAAINVTDKKSISHSEAVNQLIYQKGSQVLEMLKYIVGREGFNKAIKRYLLQHKYANVDSDDLLKAFEDELGYTLDWFWDEWVYKGGEPIYNVSYEDHATNDGKRFAQFIVTQTHTVNELVGLFKMPITFEIHYEDGSIDSKTELIEKEVSVVKINNLKNKKINFVLFDPNSEILKTVTFIKSFEMLKEQALKAPKMLDRYDAVVAMKNIPVEQKIKVLEEIYQKNTFFAIKAEVINQLLEDKSSESLRLIKVGIHDKDLLVRKEIIKNVKTIHPTLLPDYETLLLDSSYQNIALALDKLCFSFPENSNRYLEITKGIEGTNGRNVIIKWLEISAALSQNDKKYVDQLVFFTSNSFEFVTRTNAMGTLKKLNYFNNVALNNCINACLSSNTRLSGPSAECIRYFYTQDKYKKMIYDQIKNRTSKDWEFDILNKFIQ